MRRREARARGRVQGGVSIRKRSTRSIFNKQKNSTTVAVLCDRPGEREPEVPHGFKVRRKEVQESSSVSWCKPSNRVGRNALRTS